MKRCVWVTPLQIKRALPYQGWDGNLAFKFHRAYSEQYWVLGTMSSCRTSLPNLQFVPGNGSHQTAWSSARVLRIILIFLN